MILITDDQGNVVLKTPPPLQIQSDWNQKDENAVDYIKNKPFYYHYEIFSFHIDQTGQIPQEAFSKYSSVQIILTGHKGGYISGDFAEIDLNSGTIKKINSNFPVLNDIDNNPISNTVNLSRSSELTWSGIRHDIKNKTLINFALTRPDTLSAYKYIAKGSNANVPNTLLIGCAESDHLDGYAMDEEYTAIGWWYSTV
jgi:hypothetical protein